MCTMIENMMDKFDARFNKFEQKFDKGEKDQVQFEEQIGKDLSKNKRTLAANLTTIKKNFHKETNKI